MSKKMKVLPKYMCYVCMKDGKLMVCKMVKGQMGDFHPEKNGYKPKWQPNENTDSKFLAAVEKIIGDRLKVKRTS